MAAKVLVAYGSKYGATAEIAQKIGEVLKEAGLAADVLAVDNVNDINDYRAFIIGSAVYLGGWRKEVVNFLKKNLKQLAGKPIWLYSSGPGGNGNPITLLKGWRYPKKIQPYVDFINPLDITVFGGRIEIYQMNLAESALMRNIKSPTGDYRDWEKITAWAKGIAAQLGGK